MKTLQSFALILMACVAMLAIAVWRAAETDAPTEHDAAEAVSQAVADVDEAGRQIAADLLFDQRVQLAADVICLRIKGPSSRAVFVGPEGELRCVARGAEPAKHLMVAEGGVR